MVFLSYRNFLGDYIIRYVEIYIIQKLLIWEKSLEFQIQLREFFGLVVFNRCFIFNYTFVCIVKSVLGCGVEKICLVLCEKFYELVVWKEVVDNDYVK